MATCNAQIELARETCEQRGIFIYDTDERGSGLEENVRLCSLMFAYVRLMGEKCLRRLAPLNLAGTARRAVRALFSLRRTFRPLRRGRGHRSAMSPPP